MLLFLALACSHTQAVWEHTPNSLTTAPTTELSVAVSDRRCHTVADALAKELTMRRDVRVVPEAQTRLLLNVCQIRLRTEVDIEQMYPMAGMDGAGNTDRRDHVIRAEGSAILTVEVNGEPVDTLNSEGRRVRLVREGDSSHLQRRAVIRDAVVRDLSEALAQQIVPVPETVRRRWYRNPDPGTSRDLHNRAVDAERAGDLETAISIAKQAIDASRTPRNVRYLEMLAERQAAQEYAERKRQSP